jgi:competence protein ComEC
VEAFLEAERAQLPPWFVVGFGTGIAAWFALDLAFRWEALIALSAGLSVAGFSTREGRAGRAAGWFFLAVALGCSHIWARSEWVAEPKLDRPAVKSFQATVETVEPMVAKGSVRLTLAPEDPALPWRLRVSVADEDAPAGLAQGARLSLRARLMPPPPMALPGTYDFARDAWFKRIGAVGRAFAPVQIVSQGQGGTLDSVRSRLGAHIRDRLPNASGGIATALATGDQNAVPKDDAEAMRRAGLTHLLSVSGLHIAAVIGAAMLLTLKILAVSERLALRFNLVLVAAGVGALAGIGYTVLTGMQVPTMRSCIVALLVLAGIALGRDAISLRLLSVAALILLVFRPEALAGPSFQLSFAAVTAIIALHSTAWARRHFMRRDEGLLGRLGRSLLAMLATGLAVELALIPLALYHFHRAGLYGIGANLIAIPLTTFVIMPLEAGALFLDIAGLGGPLWFLCGRSIDLLLWLARSVGGATGAVTTIAAMPGWAFGLMIAGGLWLCLWTTRPRLFGLAAIAAGAIGALLAPSPDLLVTGDGMHLAVIGDDGIPMILRDRSGEFIRDIMAESAGFDGDPALLSDGSAGDCSKDSCVAELQRGRRNWRIFATRSSNLIDWPVFVRACADADIVVSSRRLPPGCAPRWLKLDSTALRRTGGVALYLGSAPRVETVREDAGEHPWAQ